MARKATLVLSDDITLELRLNFAVMAEIEDATGIDLMDKGGSQNIMKAKRLPVALVLMAGGERKAGVTAKQVAEALDPDSLEAVGEALTTLFQRDPA